VLGGWVLGAQLDLMVSRRVKVQHVVVPDESDEQVRQ